MDGFHTEEELEELSNNWYKEAKQEEKDGTGEDFDEWFGKGHLMN